MNNETNPYAPPLPVENSISTLQLGGLSCAAFGTTLGAWAFFLMTLLGITPPAAYTTGIWFVLAMATVLDLLAKRVYRTAWIHGVTELLIVANLLLSIAVANMESPFMESPFWNR